MARVAAVKFALTSFLLAVAITGPLAQARTDRLAESRSAVVHVAELPIQGRETYELIRQGGPFPFDKDGAVFGNRERSAADRKARVLPRVHRGDARIARPGRPAHRVRRSRSGAACLLLHR